jgi:hypothetical protein
MRSEGRRVAILIPCLNEEQTVGTAIAAFRAVLPHATIVVYDNNSADHTVEAARCAIVRREQRTASDDGHRAERPWS